MAASDLEARLFALEGRVETLADLLDDYIQRLVAVEQRQWQPEGGASWGQWPLAFAGVIPAMTGSGGIGAKTAGVCGYGDVTLYDLDPVTHVPFPGDTVVAHNWFSGAVGANKEIYVGVFINSLGDKVYVVPSEYCS